MAETELPPEGGKAAKGKAAAQALPAGIYPAALQKDEEEQILHTEITRLRAALTHEKQRANTACAAKEKLRQTFESEKMDFILNFSHELRSPLMKVLAYIETLQTMENLRSDKAAQYLNAMHRHVLAMSSLIEELFNECYLDVEQTYHMALVQTHRVFVHYSEELSLYVENSGRTFRFSIAKDVPPVWMDTARFAQVLSNLVENSVKFTVPKTGYIALSVDTENDFLRVCVTDNGRGISKENQAHIFDRFYSSGTSTHARHSSGLGLSIVRAIVRAHGGTVRVESNGVYGTCFEILLPLSGLPPGNLS